MSHRQCTSRKPLLTEENRKPYTIQPRLQLPSKPISTNKQSGSLSYDSSLKQTTSFSKTHFLGKKRYQFKRHRPQKKRVRWMLTAISLILIIAVLGFEQANGQGGATLADILRGTLGPTVTAQIESWYLGIADVTHQVQYKLQGQQAPAPWQVPTVIPTTTSTATRHTLPTWTPMPLASISPGITPALTGEGVWITQAHSVPTTTIPSLPIIAKTYLRPDVTRPYAVVTMLQFDTRFALLHMVAGTNEPGGAVGVQGPGSIPKSDQQALLAAFNGGFKYADGQYGMMVNGTTYVSPKPNAATIAITRQGKIILGAWGVNSQLTASNADLIAWRQNAALLIDQGAINPLTSDGAAWGGTVLNSTYTWRSGLGITANGDLVYAAGNSLSARTLGRALQAAGVVMALQTDINPFWVRAFLYANQNSNFSITKLNPYMQGTGYEYLNGTQRDFFYMTYKTPVSNPLPRQR